MKFKKQFDLEAALVASNGFAVLLTLIFIGLTDVF